MARNVLEDIINNGRQGTTQGGRATGNAAQPGRQVYDEDGTPIRSGLYTQKRYDANGKELPESRGWINVGRVMNLPDQNGQLVKRFVNLGLGIPVDSIPKFKASPNNKLRQKQNVLREQLLALLDEMQGGEERVLHLEVRIRRINDQSEIELSGMDDEEDGFQLSSPVHDMEEEGYVPSE
jgi:hypothetical protein